MRCVQLKRKIALGLLCAVLLLAFSGCSLGNSEYISVEPHEQHGNTTDKTVLNVTNSTELYNAIIDLVSSGSQKGILSVPSFGGGSLHFFVEQAINQARQEDPLCAYAVDSITYEIGTRGGEEAVALTIKYRFELSHILRIESVDEMSEALVLMEKEMKKCSAFAVVRVSAYKQTNVEQLLLEYAANNPNIVIEVPQIAVNAYPDSGEERIVEVRFTYQTDLTELRRMQDAVEPVFTASELYVRSASQVREKYAQMYAFLMERSEYTYGNSLTPAYALLCDGYGDCEAFAAVYAAMCRNAGLECYVVKGTRDGEPWAWNLINFRGSYYHLDLLRCMEQDGFAPKTKSAMEGYIWDAEQVPN